MQPLLKTSLNNLLHTRDQSGKSTFLNDVWTDTHHGSPNNKHRAFTSHTHHGLCTRTHQIAALALIIVTFFLTRLLDRSFSPCASQASVAQLPGSRTVLRVNGGGSLSWPERGYGSQLSLKIYVYEEDEIDGLKSLLYGRDGSIPTEVCVTGQWGTQVKIHRLLLKSRFRTRRKEEADLFLCLNDKEIDQMYVKVLSQMPYFRLSGGRNHIFVFPSGAGPHLFKSWATYLNRSIILTPEMTTNGALVQPLPLSKRKFLANFLGRAQRKLGRLQLIELAKQYPDKLESPELQFSGPDKLGRIEYFHHLRNAKFCFAPRGESSWTLRFYESFFVECVPVILSDQVELPFQNVIDYTQVSIKWPSTRIGPQLLEYLESIPDKVIEEMISRGREVRCWWVYASESEPCSAMRGIMWELQRKVRKFHQSTETFWLHNGSIINRNLEQFSNWKPPMPLP
ncbi:hypothetical protein AAG906_024494 [Vitis piasezkii]